jgi:isocitrate dehydrogenase
VHSRDATEDKVLKDAIAAGKRLGAIYKEPTVTPTIDQKKSMYALRSRGGLQSISVGC